MMSLKDCLLDYFDNLYPEWGYSLIEIYVLFAFFFIYLKDEERLCKVKSLFGDKKYFCYITQIEDIENESREDKYIVEIKNMAKDIKRWTNSDLKENALLWKIVREVYSDLARKIDGYHS